VALSTRPFLILYVVWHPAFNEGRSIAKKLYEHYRRELYSNVAGGTGLSVIYRQAPDPTTSAPAIIDFSEGETSAVVLLIDERFAGDENYVAWTKALLTQTETVGLSARVFPVAIASDATRMGFAEQAVRWDRWSTLDADARLRRLTSDLTYQFCRMLRSYLEHLLRPNEEEAALELGALLALEWPERLSTHPHQAWQVRLDFSDPHNPEAGRLALLRGPVHQQQPESAEPEHAPPAPLRMRQRQPQTAKTGHPLRERLLGWFRRPSADPYGQPLRHVLSNKSGWR
jgi:hypothetical protein